MKKLEDGILLGLLIGIAGGFACGFYMFVISANTPIGY